MNFTSSETDFELDNEAYVPVPESDKRRIEKIEELDGLLALRDDPEGGELGRIDGRLNMLDSPITIVLKGIFCGMLMFIAADVYKKKQSYLGAFICVPVFILAGSEHSIADMYYFCASWTFSLEALAFILLVALGNAIGGVIIPVCQKFMYEDQ